MSHVSKWGSAVALAVALLAGAGAPARASTGAETPDGWNTVFEYAGCAIAIISVPETGGVTALAATLTCARVLIDAGVQ